MIDAQFVTVRYVFYNVHPSRDYKFLIPLILKTRITIIQTMYRSFLLPTCKCTIEGARRNTYISLPSKEEAWINMYADFGGGRDRTRSRK